MTFKCLLTWGMSMIVLVGCENSEQSKRLLEQELADACYSVDTSASQVQALLDRGADVNQEHWIDGRTPLMKAVLFNKNPEVISVLINAGADVNQLCNSVCPLRGAVEENTKTEVISLLINAGADVNAQEEDNSTPLMFAAGRNENPDVITVLLDRC